MVSCANHLIVHETMPTQKHCSLNLVETPNLMKFTRFAIKHTVWLQLSLGISFDLNLQIIRAVYASAEAIKALW